MNNIKHAKVITTTPHADGSTETATDSHYEQLAHQRVEIEKPTICQEHEVLQELFAIGATFKDGSRKVSITLERVKPAGQVKVIKRWETINESFHRK